MFAALKFAGFNEIDSDVTSKQKISPSAEA